ncbi:6,7-dimethyl-8-ribityllumazine synthase [Candidatus Fermentibacteria bacterium]|nr:MAG: 6,7-dimethyl-8-ribityllumazine synthase [Candidatus Fermentibacteria bacterium]
MTVAWIHEGQLDGENLKIAVVVSRFNSFITGRLLDGAQDCLLRHGVEDENINVFWVPGAWEIPAVAANLARSRSFDAVICLGAIIRGETPHFDFVASENAKGIAQAGMNSAVPVVYGMITSDTVEQAVDRAGTKSGNKGFDAAMTAIELVNLYQQIHGFAVSNEDIPEE